MPENIFKPFEGNTFNFSCHKEIPCFNRCCAKLRLILTPYDILRMKKRLGLSSDVFLEKYTETVIEDHSRFPMVTLKMDAEKNGICPFVTEQGCTIYEDRPGACRLYPIGRAATMAYGEKDTREKFFIVKEAHCLGFNEEKSWTLDEWLNHEGVNDYNAMNDQWLEIITSKKDLGVEDATKKFQMFFMASYNLDKFRGFIFKSTFFDLFEIKADMKDKLANDDVYLMKFGFEWLKFSLFGEKTMKMKPNAVPS